MSYLPIPTSMSVDFMAFILCDLFTFNFLLQFDFLIFFSKCLFLYITIPVTTHFTHLGHTVLVSIILI